MLSQEKKCEAPPGTEAAQHGRTTEIVCYCKEKICVAKVQFAEAGQYYGGQ